MSIFMQYVITALYHIFGAIDIIMVKS